MIASLVKQYSIKGKHLNTDPAYRHPTPADIGKPMYYENGHFLGTFNGLEIDHLGDPRAKNARNEEDTGFTYNPDDVYVAINPRHVGGKSRKRRTKKTRRGKSNRGKTRRQRR